MSTKITSSKEQFDRQSSHYDVEWNSWSQHMLDWLLSAADVTASDTVLDVATGTGFTAVAFAPLVSSVVGIDVSSGMLEQAVNRAKETGASNVRFLEAAAENLPFDSRSFEIVTCRLAAHHFVNIVDFVSESYRILRAGGRLLVADTTVPDSDFLAAIWQNGVERQRDTSHWKNYSASEWRKILTSQGFVIDVMEEGGEGIKISLSSWLRKAGCNQDQESDLRRRFAEAPENVKKKYKIEIDHNGELWFTWLRILIRAVKPA